VAAVGKFLLTVLLCAADGMQQEGNKVHPAYKPFLRSACFIVILCLKTLLFNRSIRPLPVGTDLAISLATNLGVLGINGITQATFFFIVVFHDALLSLPSDASLV
jgi:hypothetical protein